MGVPALNAMESHQSRILIVDDDRAIRMLLRESFEDAGFVAEEGQSGMQAINLVGTFRPNLVLLDVVMPEMDGFETCRRIHRRRGFEDLPVIMMTAMDDVAYVNRAYDAGATDVVSKPLNWVSLMHRVQRSMELVRITRELRDAEAGQQALVELLGLLCFRIDAEGRIREFLAGTSPGKALQRTPWQGKRIEDVVLPADPAGFLARIVGAARPKARGFVERLRFGHEAGDCRIEVVSSGDDELTVVVCSPGAAGLESKPHRSSFFRQLVEKLPDPVLVMNGEGKLEYQNPAAKRQLGDGKRDVGDGKRRPVGRGALDFVHPEDAALVFGGVVDSCASNGDGSRLEFRARDRAGSWRVLDGRIVSLHRVDSAGFLLVGRDITKFKDKESELVSQRSKAEEMERVKSVLLAAVAHELRSPLNNIIGHADLLLEDMADGLNQDQLVSLDRIRKNARLILDMTFPVLDMSRSDLAAPVLVREEFSLPELLEEIRDEIELEHETSVLDMSWRIGAGIETLCTDREKLKIVLRNLIGTALQSRNRCAAAVAVDVQSTDAGVELRVTDTELGVSPERPFECQSFGEYTNGNDYSRLDLYIVKRLVELLGGDVRVDNVSGRGTSYCLSLKA